MRGFARPAWLGAALAVVLLALAAGVGLSSGGGELRYSGIPRLEFAIPRASGPRAGAAASEASEVSPQPEVSARIRPNPVDPNLVEHGTYGPLPRIGADGGRPAVAYARPFDSSDPRPKVAIILAGLGLQDEITKAALALPGAITLNLSPYAPDLGDVIEDAHRAGHEVLLDLPMEPLDYPESDPGPHTLLAAASTAGNLDRLLWLLARGSGYFGVTGAGGRFARSGQAGPILEVLAERGLALVELGSSELRTVAEQVGLPYAHAAVPIDDVPSSRAINQALAELEAMALAEGSALGVAQTYPITLERLRLWAATLDDRGLVLVPASALVHGRAGRAADLNGDEAGLTASRG